MKCPNCRNELPSSCLRCPYCNTQIGGYRGGTRYTAQNSNTEPVYNNDPRYRNQYYTEPVKYTDNSRGGRNYDSSYYHKGYQGYDYSDYRSFDYEQKRGTDINQVLLSMGIVIIGIQVIVLMLLVALLLQL